MVTLLQKEASFFSAAKNFRDEGNFSSMMKVAILLY